MHAYTPADSIFDGPITNLPSVLCVLVEFLSRAQAKTEKILNDFKFGTSIGRFSSDGAASTAVKGLRSMLTYGHYFLVCHVDKTLGDQSSLSRAVPYDL